MSDDLTVHVSGSREAVEAMLRRHLGSIGDDAREGYARRAEIAALEGRIATLESAAAVISTAPATAEADSRALMQANARIADLEAALAGARETVAEQAAALKDGRGREDEKDMELATLRAALKAALARVETAGTPAAVRPAAARVKDGERGRAAGLSMLVIDYTANRVISTQGGSLPLPTGGPYLTLLDGLATGEWRPVADFIGGLRGFANVEALNRIVALRARNLAELGFRIEADGVRRRLVRT